MLQDRVSPSVWMVGAVKTAAEKENGRKWWLFHYHLFRLYKGVMQGADKIFYKGRDTVMLVFYGVAFLFSFYSYKCSVRIS